MRLTKSFSVFLTTFFLFSLNLNLARAIDLQYPLHQRPSTVLSKPTTYNFGETVSSFAISVVAAATTALSSLGESPVNASAGAASIVRTDPDGGTDSALTSLANAVAAAAVVTRTGTASSSKTSSTGGANKEVHFGAPLAGVAAIVCAVALL